MDRSVVQGSPADCACVMSVQVNNNAVEAVRLENTCKYCSFLPNVVTIYICNPPLLHLNCVSYI
jgi:hypothetical protein